MKRYHVYYFEKDEIDRFCKEFCVYDQDPFTVKHLFQYLFKYGNLIQTTDNEKEAYLIIEQRTCKNGDVCVAYDIEEDIWFE